MKFNDAGLTLIKSFEGCKLTSYQDQRGIWTIGYGHTDHVLPNAAITQAQADEWLSRDIELTSALVSHIVPAALNDNQFSACVCLAYNIGIGNFAISSVLRCIRAADYAGASDAFLLWDKTHGVPNPGLLRRRQAESALFLSPVNN